MFIINLFYLCFLGECIIKNLVTIESVLIITQFLVVHIRYLRRCTVVSETGNGIANATENEITMRSTRRSTNDRLGKSLWNVFHQRSLGEKRNHLPWKGAEATNGRIRGCVANLRVPCDAKRQPTDLVDSRILQDPRILRQGIIHICKQFNYFTIFTSECLERTFIFLFTKNGIFH